jgi:ABC-2 type transport system ATP-binding protein
MGEDRLDGVWARDLQKSFRTAQHVVRAVHALDLTVGAGETVALLGPNGAGKSTTIDMLLGLLRPDGGQVRVFGAEPADAVRAGKVGAMLQIGSLVHDLSVRELVAMEATLYPDPLRVDDVLTSTGLTGIADRRTQKLSGGEAQRTRFALALVGNPDLLVLDEPTVALDVEARHAFWSTMRGIAGRGKAVIFATHYLEEADAFADRVVLLADGRVVAEGPPNEIKAIVGTRTIRATLPGARLETLAAFSGVTRAERRGDAVTLTCTDSDTAIRALLARYPKARDIEITAAGLEAAFLELTSGNGSTASEPEEAQAS